MAARIVGALADYPEGSCFKSRGELARSGVHRQLRAGVTGSPSAGAESIVISGQYEDDQDQGELIVYTGYGKRDPHTGKQVRDQVMAGPNLALAYSCLHGLPVRVVRGPNPASPYAPPSGYRYDGVYSVVEYWQDIGLSGYVIWRFALRKLDRLAQPSGSP